MVVGLPAIKPFEPGQPALKSQKVCWKLPPLPIFTQTGLFQVVPSALQVYVQLCTPVALQVVVSEVASGVQICLDGDWLMQLGQPGPVQTMEVLQTLPNSSITVHC